MTTTLTINNESVPVSESAIVLEAINASDIYIAQPCKGPFINPHVVFNNKLEPLD